MKIISHELFPHDINRDNDSADSLDDAVVVVKGIEDNDLVESPRPGY